MRTTSTGELVLTYCLYFATDEEVVDDDNDDEDDVDNDDEDDDDNDDEDDDDNDDEDGVAHVEQKLGITHCLLDLLTRSE